MPMLCRRAPLFFFIAFLALADLTVAQQFETGLCFADRRTYESIPLATPPMMGELPESIDLSSKFPTPGNQGKQGSCVGWAVAYAMKSYQEGIERDWSLDSTKHQFSPAFVYNQIKQPGDCHMGTTFNDAFDLLTRKGACTLHDFPYDELDCSRKPSREVEQNAAEFKIASWRRVNVQSRVEIQSHIASGFPVLVGIVVYENFTKLRGQQVYTEVEGRTLGSGHAMVVVGYSDKKNAFKLMNSWGTTTWGDGGFGWIEYDTFRDLAVEGYVTQDIVVNRPPPAPPGDKDDEKTPPRPENPVVSVQGVTLNHNVARNGVNGLQIRITGYAAHCKGRHIHIDVRFFYPNGVPLRANPAERCYRDQFGNVTTTPLDFVVPDAHFALSSRDLWFPYYALNFAPAGGRITNTVMLKAFIYLDGAMVVESAPLLFNSVS